MRSIGIESSGPDERVRPTPAQADVLKTNRRVKKIGFFKRTAIGEFKS